MRLRIPKSLHFWRQVRVFLLCLIGIGTTLVWSSLWNQHLWKELVSANIPEDYQANYGIAQVRDSITTDFISIQAKKKIWDTPDAAIFNRLASNFSIVFPKLPQKNNYKITFEQCQLLANKLAVSYSTINFDTFVDQCQWPINTIMKDINNNLSIKAKIKANPSAWPAPITVTFDARDSIDPSKDTIPANNFFWYYKDIKGNDILIGKWPVVKHTFEEEGNYSVHLTARSANNTTEGILDWEATVSVNVSPETSLVVVYANGKKLQQKTYTKIGTFEAQRWVVLDASPSQPKWWRQITSHYRSIDGTNGFHYKSEVFPTKPWSITVKIPNNGAYTVKLTITDNENNITTKDYLLAVSDPIAIIKQTPEKISTSTIARFDGNASYAIQSRIKQYNWELFDDQWEKLFASQTKDFSRQFTKPGSYTVKLKVTDELWQSNEESQTIFVDSTEPQAQFTITPRLDRQYPSQFILDASSSVDKDVTAGNDSLTYERSFSNTNQAKIEQSYDNNKSIVVSFEDIGKYKAKLTVSDSYGKITTLEKDIEVVSSLRPVVYAAPRATVWWQPITFVVKANDNIINYEWDFGDGTKSNLSQWNTKKSFNKAGVYNVKLTVTGKRGQKNTITTQVFIGEKDYPVGAYTITNNSQNIIQPNESCSGEQAFPIKRLEKFNVDINDSVNGRWEKQNLKFFFQPQDDEIYPTNRFQYQFKKIGCQYVDTIVEDTSTTKQDRKRIRFKVTNDLPSLNSLSLSFPQFGNEIGVWLSQWTKQNVFDPSKVSPLIVKVNAINPKDNDGFITQYIWYYYKKDDPSRKLELKPTPANTPSTFFTIYSEPGEIVFGVKLIDNDGGEQVSEEIIGQWPTIFIPPQWDGNMDIPIVTLLVDKSDIAVGEEVTFTTKAKILSNRPDFDAKKTIQYDFDGDGVWDKTTKDNVVKYTYTKWYPDGIRPRVQVTYRRFPVETNGDIITVKEELKPIIQQAIFDKTVIARDYSYWKIKSRKLCFIATSKNGTIACKDTTTLYTGLYSEYTYDDYGQYMMLFEVNDQFGNSAIQKQIITTTPPPTTQTPYPLSLPQAIIKDNMYVINVWEQSNNTVLLKVIWPNEWVCYVDRDINEDSNNDGKTDNDQDIQCNTLSSTNYIPTTQEVQWRIIYQKRINNELKLVGMNLLIKFIDQKINLSPEEDKLYKKINSLERSVPSTTENQKSFKTLLRQLAQTIVIDKDPTSNILQIQDFIQQNSIWLSTNQLTILQQILTEMSWAEAIKAAGWNSYDAAKAEIMRFTPTGLRAQIMTLFSNIEALGTPGAQPDKVKEYLTEMLTIFDTNAVSEQELSNPWNEQKIARSDIETIIQPQICAILWYYDISSNACRANEGDTTQIKDSLDSSDSSWFSIGTVVKRVAIVVGILWLIFVCIVIFFAIKAKLQQTEEEEEEHVPTT